MPQKQKIFSPLNRAKAGSAIASKAITSLYSPGVSSQERKKTSRKWAGRTRDELELVSKLIAFGSWKDATGQVFGKVRETKGKPLRERVRYAKNNFGEDVPMPPAMYRPAARRVYYLAKAGVARDIVVNLMHELVHATGVSKNERITANAFGRYLGIISRKNDLSDLGYLRESFQEIVSNKKFDSEIKKGFGGSAVDVFRRHLPMGATVEHKKFFGRPSFGNLGANLGRYAVVVEIITKKRGAGLFFIREVSLGKSIPDTIALIKSGKLDREIEVFLSQNPVVGRLIKEQNFS